jgi:hypothetical protein
MRSLAVPTRPRALARFAIRGSLAGRGGPFGPSALILLIAS